MEKIKIGIAEDHDLVRQGLISLLEDEKGVDVICDASNGQILLDCSSTQDLNVVLMDLEMPVLNGQETLQILRSKYPHIRVIMVSMYYTDDFIAQSIKLGARGYLPKNCKIEKVVDAIYAVHEQGYYFDDKVSKTLLFKIVDDDNFKPTFGTDILSSREKEILQLICQEKNNDEIADALFISNRTVEEHRQSILKKTNAKNAAGVVIYAIKHGLYKVPINRS
ncbi:MAG: response regulator transcription factor [Crocinitomicaceae bacterium]|nr:response regulator transcription factor [Crocinitomicaceae bacterium]